MIKTNKFWFVVVAVLSIVFCRTQLWAQAEPTNILTEHIVWNATKAYNQNRANDEVIYNCSFITNKSSSLKWRQKNGERVTDYSVTSVEGNWQDLKSDGQITYYIKKNNVTGTATFARSDGQYTIHLKMAVNGKPDIDYFFYIDNIDKV
jgi:hypothetical protein